MSVSVSARVFNQYYFNVLRQLKSIARTQKNKVVLKAIKKHYSSWDTQSDEYQAWFNGDTETEATDRPWAAYEADASVYDTWTKSEVFIYREISLDLIEALLTDSNTIHHFLTALCIFRKPMDSATLETTLAAVKATATATSVASDAEDPLVTRLKTFRAGVGAGVGAGVSKPGLEAFAGLENTSIGKMAKEIMDEIDVSELQKSIGDDGDIFKALSNPDNGIMKLVSTVSQKMMEKMSSGELKQESIIGDAMSFFGKAMGGAGGTDGGAPDMMKTIQGLMQGMTGGSGGAGGGLGGGGLADMMKAMSSMGLGGNNGGNGGGHRKHSSRHTARTLARKTARKAEKAAKGTGDKENVDET